MGTTGRLIIAPVGEQPASVFAPLFDPIQLKDADDLVLFATERTIAAAQKIELRLGRKESIAILSDADFEPPPSLRNRIRGRDVWFLANGCPTGRLIPFVRQCLDHAGTLEVVANRDDRMLSFRAGSENGVKLKRRVADVGVEALCDILDVRFENGELRHPQVPQAIPNLVDRPRERSGFLFAAFDVSSWRTPDGRADIEKYRRHFLNYGALRTHFGLEPRRLFLVGARGALRDRAEVDEMQCGTRAQLAEWWRHVDEGTAMSLAETRGKRSRRWTQPRTVGERTDWKNDGTLITTMGPQPSTTLLAVWGHQPRELVLRYDPNQPRSEELARRLQEESSIPCDVRLVSYRQPGGLKRWSADTVQLNLRPGDKLSTIPLLMWALDRPRLRRCFWLDSDKLTGIASMRPDEGGEGKTGTPVPLSTWIRFHSPHDPATYWRPRRGSETALATDLLESLAATEDRGHLEALWRRRVAPSVTLVAGQISRLRVSERRDLPGSEVPEELALGLLPSEGMNFNGRWFEWVVAGALAEAGVEDVVANVLFPREGGTDRDELDVVTRQSYRYVYWSCKTKTTLRKLKDDALAAKAQADRLIGRQQMAVLVVPKLEPSIPSTWKERAVGHLFHDQYGHIVDARFLLRKDEVRKLAGSAPERLPT